MAMTDAQKVAKYREMGQDKNLPQDVRNMYLDKANEMEQKAYEAGKKSGEFKKGGAVAKKVPMKTAAKQPMKKPVAKKAMAKGGSVKKGKC